MKQKNCYLIKKSMLEVEIQLNYRSNKVILRFSLFGNFQNHPTFQNLFFVQTTVNTNRILTFMVYEIQ